MDCKSIIKKNPFLEGKTKIIYSTNDLSKVIIFHKDNITSLNGIRDESLKGKGIINNEISSIIFNFLNSHNIKTHFICKKNNEEQLCYKVKIIPLEFVARNIAYGSLSKRLGIKDGTVISNGIYETFYKNDLLKDPLVNDFHISFLNIISKDELQSIYLTVKKINKILKKFFYSKNIILVDFKLEFGKNKKNEIILSDEITPDSCRFWDKKTKKIIDKDLFRKSDSFEKKNRKKIYDAYIEILKRLNN